MREMRVEKREDALSSRGRVTGHAFIVRSE
jgi:hypothetical protein